MVRSPIHEPVLRSTHCSHLRLPQCLLLAQTEVAQWCCSCNRYTMERTKPVGHQLIVFGRSSYIFGKYRLKKSIRATEIADKMLPSLNELGVETEGATPCIRDLSRACCPHGLGSAPIYSTAAIYVCSASEQLSMNL